MDVNVLVVFYSRYGATERLALAAGVGAIQGKANIRLRRLADLADASTIAASAEWQQNLERMNRDYVTPRPVDAEWADVIVLGSPADSPGEMASYIATIAAAGALDKKVAAPVTDKNHDAALSPTYAACACAGMMVVPGRLDGADAVDSARRHGRQLVEMARALKRGAA
jgi:hypothetical protein